MERESNVRDGQWKQKDREKGEISGLWKTDQTEVEEDGKGMMEGRRHNERKLQGTILLNQKKYRRLQITYCTPVIAS